jgi:hypothetical protein
VQFVGIGRVWPCFAAHPHNRLGVEPADLPGVFRREPAPAHDRLGAPFLERRVVEVSVGPGRQHFESERGRLGQVAGDDFDLAGFQPLQKPLEAVCIHRLAKAILDRLPNQRVVRDLTLADQVFGAGDLVGEYRRDQVFGRHPRELGRHLLAAAESR